MIYEPLANAWSRFDCPIAMADSSAVAVGTDIYVCGGFTEIYNIHKYDTLTGLWSNESRVPASSYSMRETSACHYNGNLYIAGGHSSQQALRIYNLSTKTWSMSALNSDGVTQNTQCAVAYDGYVYACNGVYSNPNYILRYSIAGNSWEIVVTAPTAYTSKATVYAGDGLVYLLSGIADNRTNVTYSLDTGIFGSLPPLPTALPGRNIGCCWHGRVYIFGHGQAGALENHTYYYYPIPAAVTLLKCGAGDKVYANAELYGRVSGLIQRYKETIIEANDYIEYHTADCAAEVTGYVERD
jgi:hypothetical protein